MLDTPIVSAYLLSRPAALSLTMPGIQKGEAATSSLVYGEVDEYIRGRADYPHLHAQILELLTEIAPFFITGPIMRRSGEVRRSLKPTNSLIGDVDTVIAATALERNLTLVTTDGDFQRVPGLASHVVPRAQLAQR